MAQNVLSLSLSPPGCNFVSLLLVEPADYDKACARAAQGGRFGVSCFVFCCPALYAQAQAALAAAG